jgi:hypothetical protein
MGLGKDTSDEVFNSRKDQLLKDYYAKRAEITG